MKLGGLKKIAFDQKSHFAKLAFRVKVGQRRQINAQSSSVPDLGQLTYEFAKFERSLTYLNLKIFLGRVSQPYVRNLGNDRLVINRFFIPINEVGGIKSNR